MKPLIGDIWVKFLAKEVEIIEQILGIGIKNKLFFIENPHEIAEMFLDLLKGLRKNELQHKELFYLDQKEYDVLVNKTNAFTALFIKGLKYKDN